MRTIHKFAVPVGSEVKHEMPPSAKLLHVEVQGSFPMIWANLDTDHQKVVRTFKAFGTGHPIPKGWVYVGSCLDEPFVWHIHEYDPD